MVKLFLTIEKLWKLNLLSKLPSNHRTFKAYWPFDDAKNNLSSDYKGRWNANLIGGVNLLNGKLGKALFFDGTTGYIKTDLSPSQIGITQNNQRTISFWIWVDPIQYNGFGGAYGYGLINSAETDDSFWGLRSFNQNEFSSFVSEHGNWNFPVDHTVSVKNQWNHISHIYDGSDILIYLNGDEVARNQRSEIKTTNGNELEIGRLHGEANTYFKGGIDELRIYNIALNQDEVIAVSTGSDLSSQTIYKQFQLNIEGDLQFSSLDGLPQGLTYDENTQLITGIPQESGVFDVDVTASNQAGESKSTIRIVVQKSEPVLASNSPKNITSTSAQAVAQVLSDGGEPLELTLFWGNNNGLDRPEDWDNSYVLEENSTEGIIRQEVFGLEKNSTYFYRWAGKNTVSSTIWSQPSLDGLIHWWSFDRIEDNKVIDEVGERHASMIDMNEGSRVFARKNKGIYFNDNLSSSIRVDNSHGLLEASPRTVSMWINTADANATLLDWGSNGSGEAWTMSLQDGQFSIAVGPEEIIQTENTLNNSSWQHLVAVLPNGSNLLSEVQVYINGEFSPPLHMVQLMLKVL